MITGIDHIDISVKDLDEAVDTLEKLGFEIVQRTNHHHGTVEMKLPGPNQPIFDLHPVLPERGNEFIGVMHIAFKVDDIDKSFEDLKGKGFKFKPETAPHFTKQTGRVLFNVMDITGEHSAPLDGWGIYFQFAGPKRVEPA